MQTTNTLSKHAAKLELLAPAGNLVSLRAALNAGADAVYLGLTTFNMRAGAANFALDDLPAVRAACDAAGARAYLTLNTIIYPGERAGLNHLMDRAEPWIDAVICWDPAVISACRKRGIPFHISTQASVANPEAAQFYRDLGAERIVLARENTLEDIRTIRQETDIVVEAFAHGAMCVSQSGRCFLSQFASGHSANRGECLQNCRREYEIRDLDDNGLSYRIGSNYILSAKDLCTLPILDQLIEAGVSSFKIEGRSKSARYVGTVVSCYRTALDAAGNGALSAALKNKLVAALRTVYNRDFSTGFYLGRPIADFAAGGGSQATRIKRNVGGVLNYYRTSAVVEIQVQDGHVSEGDTLVIEGPTTGSVEIQATGIRQHAASSRDPATPSITVACASRVRENDRVFKLVPREAN